MINMNGPLFEYYGERAEHTELLAHDAIAIEIEAEADEAAVNPDRVCWANMDDDRCFTLTGYTCEQFLGIYELCEDDIPINFGRGRRSQLGRHDRLLMVLCYLKHYETKDKLALTFGVSKTQVHRNLAATIFAITPVIYQRYVVNVGEVIEPDEVPDDLPRSPFVMDATLQEIWTPTGTYNERKRYYSGKHQRYGLKTQTLHNRRGFVLHCVPGIPGATHDLTIIRHNIDEIRDYLDDSGDEPDSILVDSGYKGLERLVPTVGPFKKPPRGDLTAEQRAFNRMLAGQRIVCERWYGRLKTRHRIMAAKYRCDRDSYEVYFKLCAALTNYTLLYNPL